MVVICKKVLILRREIKRGKNTKTQIAKAQIYSAKHKDQKEIAAIAIYNKRILW